jgi:superfamily II DNA/RNA helicase
MAMQVLMSDEKAQYPSKVLDTAANRSDSITTEKEEPDLDYFQDMDALHPITKATLKKNGFETMTEIQSRTFESSLKGLDVIGRAQTGTLQTPL